MRSGDLDEKQPLANGPEAPVSPSTLLSGELSDPSELLQVLDEFEPGLDPFVADNSAAQGSAESAQPPIPSATAKPKKRNYDPNKARSERLHELQRLRVEATDLELKLEQLKMEQNGPNCSLEHETPGHAQEENNKLPAVWEEICPRQLERRLRAEQENCRLKKKYRGGAKIIRSFEKLLFKRFSLQDVGSEAGKCVRRVEITTDFIKDVADRIFEQLAAGIEVSYHEVERILETNSPFPVDIVTQVPLMREGLSIELFDRRIIPFNMCATSDAWWRRWQDYRGQHSYESIGDVIRERCGLEMADVKTGKSATFYVQQVLQQHVEEHRVVVVWHAYFEPFTFHEKRVCGVHFLFKGYVLMKPVADSNGTGDGATQVLTCYNITPHFSDPKMQKNVETNALIKFVLNEYLASIEITDDDPGFMFDWDGEVLNTFVATANALDAADAPRWIQTPPPHITADAFTDDLLDELERVAGGRCGRVLLAPNTQSQALSIALMLGRIESERFMQDVAQAAFNGVEQLFATTYNLTATEAQESVQNNFPKPRTGRRLFQ
ncbi:hypothetical protein V7S43_002059 [Phytophthora oleae]|uniref:Uncharacterized protein n=1 Tax=Phytophthora oleae TaxID=2107226 RepID=A0ABD3G0T1_9STRA